MCLSGKVLSYTTVCMGNISYCFHTVVGHIVAIGGTLAFTECNICVSINLMCGTDNTLLQKNIL